MADIRRSLENTKYKKEQVLKTKDRNFTTFQAPEPELEPSMPVQDFFELYEQMYFLIPPEGDSNSHRYLVNSSSALLNMEDTTLNIQPLLDEIARLREELLELKMGNLSSIADQTKIEEIMKTTNPMNIKAVAEKFDPTVKFEF